MLKSRSFWAFSLQNSCPCGNTVAWQTFLLFPCHVQNKSETETQWWEIHTKATTRKAAAAPPETRRGPLCPQMSCDFSEALSHPECHLLVEVPSRCSHCTLLVPAQLLANLLGMMKLPALITSWGHAKEGSASTHAGHQRWLPDLAWLCSPERLFFNKLSLGEEKNTALRKKLCRS